MSVAPQRLEETMRKTVSLAALVAAFAFLAMAWMPSEQPTPQVNEAALNAQIDLHLHATLARLAREAQARQLAVR
jgi:hypothetical protein